MSLPGSSTMAAVDAEKRDSAAASGRVLIELVAREPDAAQDHDPQGVRERDRGRDGGRRLDQRGAAPAGDRARHARCRSSSTTSSASAREVPVLARPQAEREVRRDRPAPGRRHPAGDEDAARARPDPRRLSHRDRQDGRREPRGGAERAARGSGRGAAVETADVRRGPPRDPARQPRARGRGREDQRHQAPRDHRSRARVRVGGAVHGRDHGRPDPARRRARDSLRGTEGRTRHARDAVADLGADREGPRQLRRPAHRRPLLGRHLRHGRRARRARGVRRRPDRAGARRRLDHDRREAAPPAAERARVRARRRAGAPGGRRPRTTRAACSRSTRSSCRARRSAR